MQESVTGTHATGISRLAYYMSGATHENLLIVLHGITNNSLAQSRIAQEMNSQWRVMLVDGLGHGLSARFTAEDAEHPLEAAASEVVALIRQFSPAQRHFKTVVVAHSWGGALAGRVAAQVPELIDAMVLEDPAWLNEEWLAYFRTELPKEIEHFERIRQDPEKELAQTRRDNPEWPVDEMIGWLQGKCLVDAGMLRLGVAGDPRGVEAARHISVPTLIVSGDGDSIIVGPEGLQRIEEMHNPALTTALLPGASHAIRRDQPEQFYALVKEYLRSVLASEEE